MSHFYICTNYTTTITIYKNRGLELLLQHILFYTPFLSYYLLSISPSFLAIMSIIYTVTSAFAYFKLIVSFMINHVFFHHRMFYPSEHFCGGNMATLEEVECAACLTRIQDDDEIRELRCNHVLHGNCLDRWLECRHTACPLCHDELLFPPKVHGSHDIGSQNVLFFDFCRTDSNTDNATWWLR